MQINLFGVVQVTDQDIRDVLKFIAERRHKDKNEICLALYLINENIQGWYGHFNHIFSKEISRQLAGRTFEQTTQISEEVIEFVNTRYAVRTANEHVDYLLDIYHDYESRDQKKVKGLNPDKVIAIVRMVAKFEDAAMGRKREWLQEAIRKLKWNASPEEINRTIHELARVSEVIRQQTSSVQRDIECDNEPIRHLYLQLKNERIK